MSNASKNTASKSMSDAHARQLAGLFTQHLHLLPSFLNSEEAKAATNNMSVFMHCACEAWRRRTSLHIDTSEEKWNEFYETQYGVTPGNKAWIPHGHGVTRRDKNLWQICVSNKVDLKVVIAKTDEIKGVENFSCPNIMHVFDARKILKPSSTGYRVETSMSIDAVEFPGVAALDFIGQGHCGITLLELLLLDQFIGWSGQDQPGDNRIFLDALTYTVCSGTICSLATPEGTEYYCPTVTRWSSDRALNVGYTPLNKLPASNYSVRPVKAFESVTVPYPFDWAVRE